MTKNKQRSNRPGLKSFTVRVQKTWRRFLFWNAELILNSHWYTFGRPLGNWISDLLPSPYKTETQIKESL